MKSITAISKQSAPSLHQKTPAQLAFFSRYRVEYDDGLDNTLVVDGLPVIDKSKLEKLLAKVAKEFSKKGCPIKADDIFVPWDESSGKSKGCAHPRQSHLHSLICHLQLCLH